MLKFADRSNVTEFRQVLLVDMCVGMRVDMRVDMHADMHIDFCI